jgi:hypothetical protein
MYKKKEDANSQLRSFLGTCENIFLINVIILIYLDRQTIFSELSAGINKLKITFINLNYRQLEETTVNIDLA